MPIIVVWQVNNTTLAVRGTTELFGHAKRASLAKRFGFRNNFWKGLLTKLINKKKFLGLWVARFLIGHTLQKHIVVCLLITLRTVANPEQYNQGHVHTNYLIFTDILTNTTSVLKYKVFWMDRKPVQIHCNCPIYLKSFIQIRCTKNCSIRLKYFIFWDGESRI